MTDRERDPVERVEALIQRAMAAAACGDDQAGYVARNDLIALVRDLERERDEAVQACVHARDFIDGKMARMEKDLFKSMALLREIARSGVEYEGSDLMHVQIDRETWAEVQSVAGREG